MTENTRLDPSTLGFMTVAAVSLPLAFVMFQGTDTTQGLGFFVPAGIILMLVGLLAWKCNANFGFAVFTLVGLAVFLSGSTAYPIGEWGNIVFGIIFVFAIVWSVLIGAGKNLTLLLVTTALIFLLLGIASITSTDLNTVVGIVALLNFILNFYMGMSCACPEKIKPF